MKHFIGLGTVDVLPALLQLDRNPQLWNENRDRKDRAITAHNEMDDIWLRFRPREQLNCDDDYSSEHFSIWYPAINPLYEMRSLIHQVMHRVNSTHLGGILITKIPPGGVIKPHIDSGWHATYHNCKVYVAIKSNAQCYNVCEDEVITMATGDVMTFDNTKLHSVENKSNDDRITLIISMHCD